MILDDLKKFRINLNPQLGQHLLIDEEVLNLIAKNVPSNKTIIEIGAGMGQLTEKLTRKSKKVIAIEIDKQFNMPLKNLTRNYRNLTTIYENVLSLDFQEIIDFKKSSLELVGNLPYQIIEPLFMKIIFLPIKSAIFLIPEHRDKAIQLNKLNLLIQTCFEEKVLTEVSENSFFPPPQTKSILVRLIPRQKTQYLSNKQLYIFRKLFYSSSKGTLVKNVLRESFIDYAKAKGEILTKKQAKDLISSLNIPTATLEKSFEQLNNQEISLLYQSTTKPASIYLHLEADDSD